MRIFITGATGFIGRALVLRLQRDGHALSALVRDVQRARSRIGADVALVAADADNDEFAEALLHADAVVNLAGEPLIGRWTARRRARMFDSRVRLTERLVAAMRATGTPPRVLVSGSAVGYYGDRGDEVLTEENPPGDDFLAELCSEWERAAFGAEHLGVRVLTVRTGIVLGRDGGALAKLLTPFRLGVGGRLGGGRQYMPWIHLHDYVDVISAALADERYSGAVNATAPAPVTNREFTRALGAAVRRPAFLPVPGLALKAALGEASTVLLASQRALPKRLEELGFGFRFSTIDPALADIVARPSPVEFRAAEGA
jgi:uncharacterized protein (TIGR01777 family)